MRVAFYKAVHPDYTGIYSRGVQIWTKSIYSHCEIIFSDGQSASASFLDHGVRFKEITYDPAKWDFVDLPDSFEADARAWFVKHEHESYDLLGNLHFVISPIGDDKTKWFCSEAIAAALGLTDAWRFDPGDLYPVLVRLSQLTMPAPPLSMAA